MVRNSDVIAVEGEGVAFDPQDQEGMRGLLALLAGQEDLDVVRREISPLTAASFPEFVELEATMGEFLAP